MPHQGDFASTYYARAYSIRFRALTPKDVKTFITFQLTSSCLYDYYEILQERVMEAERITCRFK